MKVFKYSAFALFSILVNLSVQRVFHSFYSGFFSLYAGLLLGTGAGLIIKYILDKKYIFYHRTETKAEETKKFMLYSLMGVLTTFIFWGFEIGFDLAFDSENAKYMGGALGLGIGYVTKYFLDKGYVFVLAKA